MTRIVSGTVGGRRLTVPPGEGTRPTSERAREALFSTLEAIRGPLVGARVLDLYAGSGAVGLEALSRGAAAALLVEADTRAVRVIEANIAALGLTGADVVADRVQRFVTRAPDGAAYDICFADPPYAEDTGRLVGVLCALADGFLSDDAVVVIERATRDPEWLWPRGFSPVRSRRYGEATLWYGRRS
jgi:16S rRNA (guanine966-N2)-methyltransferase